MKRLSSEHVRLRLNGEPVEVTLGSLNQRVAEAARLYLEGLAPEKCPQLGDDITFEAWNGISPLMCRFKGRVFWVGMDIAYGGFGIEASGKTEFAPIVDAMREEQKE